MTQVKGIQKVHRKREERKPEFRNFEFIDSFVFGGPSSLN